MYRYNKRLSQTRKPSEGFRIKQKHSKPSEQNRTQMTASFSSLHFEFLLMIPNEKNSMKMKGVI
jgi:hypothetical protein